MTERDSVRASVRLAKTIWGDLPKTSVYRLRKLTEEFGLSVALGDIQLLGGRWYVTHGGLLRLAFRRRCYGVRTTAVNRLCDPTINRWVFKAIVYKTGSSRFIGYGDADPSNVSSLVRGAEMRVAETRAVNRALRKAYGIGLCSIEELGSQPVPVAPPNSRRPIPQNSNGSPNGQASLRDKLCLLIRHYELDPILVKRYATDFCGTETLRDASRDLVEAFVSTITNEAANNRTALVCKLNSYNQPEEVRS
jgi:hypothetical protein